MIGLAAATVPTICEEVCKNWSFPAFGLELFQPSSRRLEPPYKLDDGDRREAIDHVLSHSYMSLPELRLHPDKGSNYINFETY
jgi:hypothetical protein